MRTCAALVLYVTFDQPPAVSTFGNYGVVERV